MYRLALMELSGSMKYVETQQQAMDSRLTDRGNDGVDRPRE